MEARALTDTGAGRRRLVIAAVWVACGALVAVAILTSPSGVALVLVGVVVLVVLRLVGPVLRGARGRQLVRPLLGLIGMAFPIVALAATHDEPQRVWMTALIVATVVGIGVVYGLERLLGPAADG